VKTADSTAVVRQFGRYLGLVESGQSVRIKRHGRVVARLVPDRGFMSGEEFSALFEGYQPDELDKEAAEEIRRNLGSIKSRSRAKVMDH
jgi:antitoxin (DNA-binding transcriptional repressor) of toxin-antitoxin stability system